MLKTHNKVVSTYPEMFVKCIDEKTISVFADRREKDFTFEIWKKVQIASNKENGNGQADMQPFPIE